MAEKFDIQEALEWKPNLHEFSHLHGNKVEVTAFAGNQALKFTLKAGAEIEHGVDGFFASIDCLDGAVSVKCKAKTYELDANSKTSLGFSFPAPYTITATQDSRILVLVRPWLKRYRTLAEIEAAENRADIKQAKRVLAKSDPSQRKSLSDLRRAVAK